MFDKSQSDLGSRIAKLRNYNFISQADLAKKIGVDRTVIGKIENGVRNVSSDELGAIASVFNISTDYLLSRANEEPSETSPLSKQDREMLSLYGRKTRGMTGKEKKNS